MMSSDVSFLLERIKGADPYDARDMARQITDVISRDTAARDHAIAYSRIHEAVTAAMSSALHDASADMRAPDDAVSAARALYAFGSERDSTYEIAVLIDKLERFLTGVQELPDHVKRVEQLLVEFKVERERMRRAVAAALENLP